MSLSWQTKKIQTRCRLLRFFIPALFFFACLVPFAHAAEQKVWNAYQTALFSGSYRFVIPSDLPPGARGMTPTLSISYNSFLAGNRGGWLGAGWEVPLTFVQANTDGTFSLFLDGARHELVHVAAEGRYHTKIETYLKIEKKTGAPNENGDYWTVRDTSGTEYRFGANIDSEHKINTSDPSVTPHVWRWSLDRIRDTNGNCIYFTYAENPTANDRGAVYLSRIEYNSEKKRLVEFVLEDSDRSDMQLVIDQGSEVLTARRLAEIRVSVNGQLAKKLVFQYVLNSALDTSLLSSITRYGSDGTTALQPERFEYTPFDDGRATELLTRITGALGAGTTIDYSPSSSAPNTAFPENYWLVTSVARTNGMTGSHAFSAASTLAYENGAYDAVSREFRGFGKVTETQPDGSQVVYTFHQDEARKGREEGSTLLDPQNAPYSAALSFWSSSLSAGVHTVRLEKNEGYTYDGAQADPRITRTEYRNYDAYGNVGLEIDHGDIAVTGDETSTTREFVANPDLWIVNRVKHSTITAGEDATKLRESWLTYDRAFDPGTPPFAGNVTREEHWNGNGANPVITYKYDSHGNLTRKTDPNGYSTEIVYDATYQTFPELAYNAKNHLTATIFNPATGKPVSVTDPNGSRTTYVYDVFNRLSQVIRPYDSEAFPTFEFQYVINAAPPHWVVVKKRETAGGSTLDSIQVMDGLGKVIQTRSEYDDPASTVTSDTFYDAMGRVGRQSNAYLSDGTVGYTAPNTNIPCTRTAYDILGRPTVVTHPDGTFITTAYDHWTAIVTDENQQAKSQAFDANGNLVEVVENNQGEAYATRYRHSPLGELLAITDHLGNTSTSEYDSLGRKTRTVDVDFGERLFSYDLGGNLVSQTDARGTVIKYQYDVLNRPTLVDYPRDKDIQLIYDLGTKGALSTVYNGLGTDRYTYDQRGRKIQEERTMDGQTWVTRWDYDSMDRVARQTYPDGETVQYTYSAGDQMAAIQRGSQPLLGDMAYNASGQLTQKRYANGWSTTFSYDPSNLRLTSIATTKDGARLQELAYTYDPSGNVKTLKDAVSGRTETFAYDDLYRMVSARDDLATGGFDTSYAYNAVGNMLSETDNKTQSVTQYTYGQGTAKPHAVTGKTDAMPIVGSMVVDKGKAYCTRQQVTLDNISMGNPTHYMASEDPGFGGASWQVFSTAPSFTLSPGFGNKVVYFKVKNANGESKVKNDDIQYLLDTDGDAIPDVEDGDKDNDGIPDAADTEPLNPANARLDADGDGLSTLQEYLYETNPDEIDSDGDGWSDSHELSVSRTSPNHADTDGDGISDPQDANPNNPYNEGFSTHYSVKRWTFPEGGGRRHSTLYTAADILGSGFSRSPLADTDGDGIPDTWEIARGLDPSSPADAAQDGDGDGLTSLQEYLQGTNPAVKDSDHDGWSDYHEIFIHHTDPGSADSDGDGIPDTRDPDPSQQTTNIATSENFTLSSGNFNAGGTNRRSSGGYAVVADRIGGLLSESANFYRKFSIIPEGVDFETTDTNESRTATLTVSNEGIDNLIIGTVSLGGADQSEYALSEDDCSGVVLSPGVSCSIQVSFMPRSPGAKGANLSIQYDDGEVKNASIPVSGIATTASQQTLSVSTTGTGSGTVLSDPAGILCGPDCSAGYAYNSNVTLTAQAAAGSIFSGWSGAGCSGTGTCTVTMNSAQTVTAGFVSLMYTIIATTGSGGAIEPSGQVIVRHGADTTFNISPGSGYRIADVLVDGGSQGSVTSYTFAGVAGDHTLSASFVLNTHTIATTAGAHGTISPSQTVNQGEDSSPIVVTPDTCYQIASVLVDGVSQTIPDPRSYSISFSDVTANHTVSATFASLSGIEFPGPADDPDGDGFTDGDEAAAGSNPCSASSTPRETWMSLKAGFNLVAIPADVDSKPDLRDWLPAFGGSTQIDKVMIYDGESRKMVTLRPEDPSNEAVMLKGGEGIMVYAEQEKTVPFSSVLCSSHDLQQGFNLVGFACASESSTAFQLLNRLGPSQAISIQRFVPETGAFETAGFNSDGINVGADFSIVPGEGYFIFMRQHVTGFGF